MKAYITWEEVRKLTLYDEAIQTIRNSWYQFAEGFVSFSGTYQQYKNVNEELNKVLPNGWDAHLDFDGNLLAYFHIPNQKSFLVIYKLKNGYETVHFS